VHIFKSSDGISFCAEGSQRLDHLARDCWPPRLVINHTSHNLERSAWNGGRKPNEITGDS